MPYRPSHLPSRSPQSGKLSIVLVLLLAVSAGLGLLLSQRLHDSAPTDLPPLKGTLAYPQPRAVPAFSLDTASGTPITADTLRGRWTVLFIGFTHCPDVCPTTLGVLAAASKLWADLPQPQQPRILFLSVDPERDSPQIVADYAAFFGRDILAATADQARLEPFTRNLGMVYMKTPLEGDDYTIDHSSSLAILDPDVQLVAVMRPPLQAAVIASDLQALIAHRSPR